MILLRAVFLVLLFFAVPVRGDDTSGRNVALIYCQTCHAFPEPHSLDRETWLRGALPHMAPWLGVARLNLAARPDGKRLEDSKIFPPAPLLSESNWLAIKAYYSNAAPAEPATWTNRPATTVDLKLFKVKALRTTVEISFTTLVKIDQSSRTLYVGDGQDRTLKAIQGDNISTWRVDSAPVNIVLGKTNFMLSLVGRTFPSDELAGQVWSQSFDTSAPPVKLLRGLPRLAHTSRADLDGDGLEDFVICGYGNSLGGLILAKQYRADHFTPTEIASGPGFIATHIQDFDRDGRPDIMALRGQTKEGVEIYFNRGGTNFQFTSALQFPPTFGTAAWQVIDFDGDGELDLLIASGDNGDYPSKPKAYHGLRLYKGNGRGRFMEIWSFPMNGTYGVRAADFDLDGDLDIAAIAFFPDYEKYPVESFLYLENTGALNFKPHTIADSQQGRWIVLDAGDLDGDGDVDLALGSFVRGPTTTWIPDDLKKRWASDRISAVILENQTR